MRSDIVAAARAVVGARFRPQGRDAESGLDCVGVAAAAYGARLSGAVPASYAQRGGSEAGIRALVAQAGLRLIAVEAAGTGDLLLFETGPMQWHLAVSTGVGFVHADAGLRRVTEVPGPPPWPIAGAWTLE